MKEELIKEMAERFFALTPLGMDYCTELAKVAVELAERKMDYKPEPKDFASILSAGRE